LLIAEPDTWLAAVATVAEAANIMPTTDAKTNFFMIVSSVCNGLFKKVVVAMSTEYEIRPE
jgi:hypothetical protein